MALTENEWKAGSSSTTTRATSMVLEKEKERDRHGLSRNSQISGNFVYLNIKPHRGPTRRFSNRVCSQTQFIMSLALSLIAKKEQIVSRKQQSWSDLATIQMNEKLHSYSKERHAVFLDGELVYVCIACLSRLVEGDDHWDVPILIKSTDVRQAKIEKGVDDVYEDGGAHSRGRRVLSAQPGAESVPLVIAVRARDPGTSGNSWFMRQRGIESLEETAVIRVIKYEDYEQRRDERGILDEGAIGIRRKLYRRRADNQSSQTNQASLKDETVVILILLYTTFIVQYQYYVKRASQVILRYALPPDYFEAVWLPYMLKW
ncbi:hypothetical protein ARMGADRAFT_1040182 [Armillaria gallica]|uniref:Uncharacterized protein n=1 Tax=Armillaria gallica TaxID=47427 RepID=A0A2H3CB37_ARMGA|nr:hypothetical protein ARMGADRAFT_1040182 [Armillaria gallica]